MILDAQIDADVKAGAGAGAERGGAPVWDRFGPIPGVGVGLGARAEVGEGTLGFWVLWFA